MRLIDADALLKRKGCVYDSEGHVLFAVGTGDIVHAHTIDAIPVEWLEEHDGVDIRDSNGNIYARRRITVVEALSMWQKEQEAQDG